MGKQFPIFLGVGILIVGLGWYLFYAGTKDLALAVNGEVLKTRIAELSPSNTFVMTDFRIRNTSGVDFMLKDAQMFITLASGREVEGNTVSRSDIDNILGAVRILGPKYNEVLIIRDRVKAHVSIDRMVAATFNRDEAEIAGRKALRLHLNEIDGKEFDLMEKK
jgi:hypothetical protein